MPVYTRRLGALLVSGASWIELYRAPASGVVVVRDVVLTNASTGPVGELAIRFRPLTKAGDVWVYYSGSQPVGTYHLELRQVLAPGEALEAICFAGQCHVLVTGYVF